MKVKMGNFLTGPVVSGAGHTCQVCETNQKTNQHSIIRIYSTLSADNDPKKTRVAEWMCTKCFANAVTKGRVVLFIADGTETVPDDIGDMPVDAPEAAEEDAAFEVSW